MNNEDCIFCKIVNGEIKSEIVYDDDNFIGILDIKPKAKGHTIIISKKHYKNTLDLPVTLGNELLEATKKIGLKLIEDKKGEGFNVIYNTEPAAGQLVFHFHCHVIPRKNGDGLKGLA